MTRLRRALAGFLTLALLGPGPAFAAWSSLNTLGSVQSKAADQATLVLTTTATLEAGNVGVLCVAFDNWETVGDGDGEDITSVVDSAGNTWTKGRELSVTVGGAQKDGAVSSLWYVKAATQLSSGGTITITFDAAETAAFDATAATAWEFSITSGNVVTNAGASTAVSQGVDPDAITISSLTNQAYLWAHCLAGEGPNGDAYTWDADYTTMTANGTTGGSAATNMHVRGGFRVFTGTTDTVDVTSTTADRDYAQVYVALLEEAPPEPPDCPKTLALLGVGC